MKLGKTGLVVVNYNDYKTTCSFIWSISSFKIIDNIVVVDNCSNNDSYIQLCKYATSKIKIIKSDTNGGYSYGNNIGIKYLIDDLKCDNIIVSNPDIIVAEKDILQLIKTLQSNDKYAVVGPIIKEGNSYNRGWKLPTPNDDILLNIIYLHRFLRKKLLYYYDNYYKKKIVPVDCLSGCFFICKGDILKKIDFFDENVFLYYEENILGYKIKQLKMLIIINTSIMITHNHSVSIDKNINRIDKYKFLKASQRYYHKNYSKASLLQLLSLFITNKTTLLIIYLYCLIMGRNK